MNLIDYAILSITSSILIFFQLLSYKKLRSSSTKIITIKNIIIILLGGIIVTVNSYTIYEIYRAFISWIMLIIIEYIVFKDKISDAFIFGSFSYVIITLCELVFSIAVISFGIFELEVFDKHVIFKTIFSLIIVISGYLICRLKITKKIIDNIYRFLKNSLFLLIIACLLICIVIVLDFRYVLDMESITYIFDLILLLIFGVLIFMSIYNNIKSRKEVQKTEILLNFMSEYEKIIDEDRYNKHEMLNNLLILKSIKNKSSKEYEEILDDFINTYDNKKSNKYYKNISKLPTGLKGIFYYKLNDMNKYDVKINFRISKQIIDFDKLNRKDYVTLCKIIGIVLDNSIEAVIKAKNKIINIEVYPEDNSNIILVENTYKEKIDIKKIKNKYYSTKGKNRGLGLYILNLLVRDNENIFVNQYLENDMFVTKINIK